MKNLTLSYAINNTKNLTTRFSGYGHYKISMIHRGKRIATTTTNVSAIDDYKSEPFEKDGRKYRMLRGYRDLVSELIRNGN